jgi:hypothetical protein
MGTNKIDLSKLRSEIETRKNEQNIISTKLGESTNRSVAVPKDKFLFDLKKSIDSGVITPSINLIKEVENSVASKRGEQIKHTNIQQNIPIKPSRTVMLNEEPDRDELMFQNFNAKKNQTLAESLESFSINQNGGHNNTPQQFNQQTPQISNDYLIQVVNDILSKNYGLLVEDTIKSTILEMYAIERINKVLNENKDMIKGLIREVIKEIQQAKK